MRARYVSGRVHCHSVVVAWHRVTLAEAWLPGEPLPVSEPSIRELLARREGRRGAWASDRVLRDP